MGLRIRAARSGSSGGDGGRGTFGRHGSLISSSSSARCAVVLGLAVGAALATTFAAHCFDGAVHTRVLIAGVALVVATAATPAILRAVKGATERDGTGGDNITTCMAS